MKHINSPKRPTLQQKKFIAKHHLVPENWLVVDDVNKDYMWVKNKRTGRLNKLVKGDEKMQLSKYVDKRGWIYFIRMGLGENNFKTFYKKPDRMGEHGCRMTKWVHSIGEAQAELDELAKKKGWNVLKEGE